MMSLSEHENLNSVLILVIIGFAIEYFSLVEINIVLYV
jgi:hypothetical protein